MNKYETRVQGDFDDFLFRLHSELKLDKVDESSECRSGGLRCMMRVYEQYNFWGKGFMILTVMVVESEDDLFVSIIPAGGGSVFSDHPKKLLKRAVKVIEGYKQAH